MAKLSTILLGAIALSLIAQSSILADETHTVQTNGLGDYTSIAAALSAVNTNLLNRGLITIRGQGGGNYGSFTVTGGSNPSAADRIRIETDGSGYVSGGISVLQNYTEIGDMLQTNATGAGISIYNANGCLVERCRIDSPNNEGIIATSAQFTQTVPHTFRNNIITGYGAPGGLSLQAFSDIGVPATGSQIIYDNTIADSSEDGIRFNTVAGGAAATLNVYVTNNYAVKIADDSPAGTRNLYLAYNATEDTSATNWGGSGAIINVNPTNQFRSVTSDLRLKPDSILINAGTTTDVTRDYDQRLKPQYRLPDIGAYEHPNINRVM